MRAAALILLLGLASLSSAAAAPPIRVAGKSFVESYVLSELSAQVIENTGEAAVQRMVGLAGPNLVAAALKSGEVDLDISYTGDLNRLFLPEKRHASLSDLRQALARAGLLLGEPLGFNNTYALAVRRETAERLGLHNISDLRQHPTLRGGFGPDFLNHDDGLYRLLEVYGVKLGSITTLDHALSYAALASQKIDLADAYTTDGLLSQFDLRLLRDDQGFFPGYYAIPVMRQEVAQRYPRSWAAILQLAGRISEAEMTRMNAQIESKQATPSQVAREFLRRAIPTLAAMGTTVKPVASSRLSRILSLLDRSFWERTREHSFLVFLSLVLSMALGIPIGIVAFAHPRFGRSLVALTGLLQTIPTLALLCFLIPLLGIGVLPTLCALVLYGLLPIVQGTAAGLLSIEHRMSETARILGLGRWQRLWLVELPLASRSILSGIETTAVINVATATIAAGIGAGGYGSFILSGMAMNDNLTILKGAVPSAIMAMLVHELFALLQRSVVPAGLRVAERPNA